MSLIHINSCHQVNCCGDHQHLVMLHVSDY